jgi:hypothetical protein
MQAGFGKVTGIVLVEDLQVDLRRITVRINWSGGPQGTASESSEKALFVHRHSQ